MKNCKEKQIDSSVSPKTAFMFILPSLAGCLLFIFVPSVFSFLLGFCDWNLLSDIKYTGLENYKELINSREFWFILKNTIIYALFVTIFATMIPLILAAVINKGIKGSEIYKTSYFIPFITPTVVTATLWLWVFDPNIGLINSVFKMNEEWLYSSDTALWVLIFVSVWKLVGYNLIIFISGFASVNKDIYEACEIDGASEFDTFFKITVPLITPTIFFVLLITAVSSFQVFDLIYLMTQGGPDNSTNVLVYWLYKNAFEFFEPGKASAIAYILFLMIFILTLIQWKLRKKWVMNEND